MTIGICNNLDNVSKCIGGDMLILTGDIKAILSSETDHFGKWCSKQFKHTFIVMGNEDYYDGTDVSDTLDCYVRNIADNVCFVNNTSTSIGKVEIFFTTLWKDCNHSDISDMLSDRGDFEEIICRGSPLTIQCVKDLHEICVEWLMSALIKSHAEVKIVVSHHRFDDALAKSLNALGVDLLFSSASSISYLLNID